MWDLSRQVNAQQESNTTLQARNNTLDAEVRDLKSGQAAIEERARSELGMIKQDEVFYQVVEQANPLAIQPPKYQELVEPKAGDKKPTNAPHKP